MPKFRGKCTRRQRCAPGAARPALQIEVPIPIFGESETKPSLITVAAAQLCTGDDGMRWVLTVAHMVGVCWRHSNRRSQHC
jgi:hypothetical protein